MGRRGRVHRNSLDEEGPSEGECRKVPSPEGKRGSEREGADRRELDYRTVKETNLRRCVLLITTLYQETTLFGTL